MFGDRTILKKDLSFINEKNHKELVKTKMEERKTVKLALKDGERRGLPPVPSVPIPMTETREETQKKLIMAELEGPIKLEGEYIKYLYFKDRTRKERGIETRTLPEIDIETRRKIGQEQGGLPKVGRAPISRLKENEYEKVDEETEDELETSFHKMRFFI